MAKPTKDGWTRNGNHYIERLPWRIVSAKVSGAYVFSLMRKTRRPDPFDPYNPKMTTYWETVRTSGDAGELRKIAGDIDEQESIPSE